MTDVITSQRLDLVTLNPEVLRLTEIADLAGTARALNAVVAAQWPMTVPARRRRDQLRVAPEQQPWLARAMVLRAQRRVVGTIGFHAAPDTGGWVEIGYAVLPGHQRQGFAAEAAHALTAWAHDTGQAQFCRASIAPGNGPSLALAAALGFVRVGEQQDPEDGLEWVFERRLPLLTR